jgi:hypothetical protein
VEQPKLWKGIGEVAWAVRKFVGLAVIFFTLFFFAFQHHPLIGFCVFCALAVAAQAIYVGKQNYKWKKRDFERERENEECDRQ